MSATVARKGYWAPTLEELTPVPVEPLEPAVSGALTKLQSRQDDRVAHVTTGFAPGADGRTTLMAIWKPVARLPRPSRTAARSKRAATAARRSAPARARWATTAPAWPGWRCRPATSPSATARAAPAARWWIAGRKSINVPDLSGAIFAIASPTFIRARTTVGFQALRKGQPGAPSPDREFRTSDLFVVRAAVAGSAARATRQRDRRSADPARQAAGEVAGRSLVAGEHQVELPVRALALGEYVLRFTAQRSGESAVTTAAFAIVR